MNKCFLFFGLCLLSLTVLGQNNLRNAFLSPPESAKPWVFWYWLHGAVSAEGITADLEAMERAGIGGAYLMPIKDTKAIYSQPVRQLSPRWWDMVRHAMSEAKRLQLKLGIHVSDGFALAGGPWITPEKSMQKLAWSATSIEGGSLFDDTLALPEINENYYRDVALLAFPSLPGAGISTQTMVPVITSSRGDTGLQYLINPHNKQNFASDEDCWIQYTFREPFTLRSVVIRSRVNYAANRLIIQTSNDGKHFTTHTRLQSPRHGWQDWGSPYTHTVPEIKAKYFRFVYTKEGTEPGAEELDNAKWKPVLKVSGIELLSAPRVHQYEGKNGEVWRLAKETTAQQVAPSDCVPIGSILDLTSQIGQSGKLTWQVPPGNWTLLRIGHTSTGNKNETAGGGKGLECDKFSPEAVTLQFNSWFKQFYQQGGNVADSVIRYFHVDSWECGSQNWSANFREEFKKRRGYDLFSYLPAMAGFPVQSANVSEKFLYDVRSTIAELVNDKFYGTLQALAHQQGVMMTAESVAPTMVSDGMLHYSKVDLPMGEFWLQSPSHDKPNDMTDAISGAHVYGKPIVQAEAFTELRMRWDEHPGSLKALADRNFALGINRLVYHVFMHNPWTDKKPGITLDAIGTLFQRDQSWWPQAKAWVNYASRCQALLQLGKPVTDIAVFTGEELPRRSLLPERLVNTLPGIMGDRAVVMEKMRLRNTGQPLTRQPTGVTYASNTSNAQTWNDPLRGYAYDSFNPDALLRLGSVKDGRIHLSSGATYGVLVIPAGHNMQPEIGKMSTIVANKIKALVDSGATVLLAQKPYSVYSLQDTANGLHVLTRAPAPGQKVLHPGSAKSFVSLLPKGRLLTGAFNDTSFGSLGIAEDFLAMDENGRRADSLVWTHRAGNGFDIFFVSNQTAIQKTTHLSLRLTGKVPELWNPVDGSIKKAKTWKTKNGRTLLPVRLDGQGSLFVVFQENTKTQGRQAGKNWKETAVVQRLRGPWQVHFDTAFGGPLRPVVFQALTSWHQHPDSTIRHYSGEAVYKKDFPWSSFSTKPVWLSLGEVNNMAEIVVNGVSCGFAWTAPYQVDISTAIKRGINSLEIRVANTWNNRLVGDSRLAPEKRITYTAYPFKMEDKPLLPAGLIGPVTIEVEKGSE